MNTEKKLKEVSIKTADNLKTVAESSEIRKVSNLSLPEIDNVVDLVARIVPAGNIPGVILSGLARLSGRKPPLNTLKRDVNLLFKGVEQNLDKAVYLTVFAGPSAVIYAYQNLLKIAGKDPNDAFPEGIWQFYVDYALREDTARHANETHGFDSLLKEHQIQLSGVDRATAWVMAAIYSLHQYSDLLKNEWRERVVTHLLEQATRHEPGADRYTSLYRKWEQLRPYWRTAEAATQSYPVYRQTKFDLFLEEATRGLRPEIRDEWLKKVQAMEKEDLPAYQKQMSILAYLDPDEYGEARTPFSLKDACVGLIYQGRYYLIPACVSGTKQPAEVGMVRAQIAALMSVSVTEQPVKLTPLAKIRRAAWPTMREVLPKGLIKELDKLRHAPILVNCDPRPRNLTLPELRQGERGIGDHALTLFDTGETIVFDQSHIFFDGAWGAAFAEIITGEALSWARYLSSLPAESGETKKGDIAPPKLNFPPYDVNQQAPTIIPEASAETDAVNLRSIFQLRKLFKMRNDLLGLTVNDLLILYRAIHAATYQPNANVMQAIEKLSRTDTTQHAAKAALESIEKSRKTNPAMVIPVDASRSSPRSRLYPMTFEVPLADLDLLRLHELTVTARQAYDSGTGDRTTLYTEFDRLQRSYLAILAGFGAMLGKAKDIAIAGESASVGTIKLLAHMPTALQRMLDKIPSRFEVLNDLIKGREVLSNVGAVVSTSTLTRFITAKDDNDKKTLAWGFISDSQGVMRITLRDFRPHVAILQSIGQKELANRLAQDYLDAYANGLNSFMEDLIHITETSRETQLNRN